MHVNVHFSGAQRASPCCALGRGADFRPCADTLFVLNYGALLAVLLASLRVTMRYTHTTNITQPFNSLFNTKASLLGGVDDGLKKSEF